MTELALVTFIAIPSLIEHAKDGLRIHAGRYLLHLDRFQESSLLLSALLILEFLFLPKGPFPFLLESRARFTGSLLLLLDVGYFSLDFCRSVFLLLHR